MSSKRNYKYVPHALGNWQREAHGIVRFLARCHEYQGNEGQDWVRGMVRHYADRMRHMCERPPGGKTRAWARMYFKRQLKLADVPPMWLQVIVNTAKLDASQGAAHADPARAVGSVHGGGTGSGGIHRKRADAGDSTSGE